MSRAKNKRKKSKRYASTLDQDASYAYEEGGSGEKDVVAVAAAADALHPDLARYALTRSSQIPPSIRKYWNHRTTLFSYFDGSSPTGKLPLLDEQSWFSVTPESIAARIAERCRSHVILDAFCGAGGNAIQFALTCQHVIAIDIDPIKLLLAKHNAEVYGVSENITFLLGDWRDFVEDYRQARGAHGFARNQQSKWLGCEAWNIDVIFLSPPWGGTDYRERASDAHSPDQHAQDNSEEEAYEYYPLSRLEPDGGVAMYKLARSITPSVCMYLPRTIDLNELAEFANDEEQGNERSLVDVEEQWMGDRCKALSCYFGPLLSPLTTT